MIKFLEVSTSLGGTGTALNVSSGKNRHHLWDDRQKTGIDQDYSGGTDQLWHRSPGSLMTYDWFCTTHPYHSQQRAEGADCSSSSSSAARSRQVPCYDCSSEENETKQSLYSGYMMMMSLAEPVIRLVFHPYCRRPSDGRAHSDLWAGAKPAA